VDAPLLFQAVVAVDAEIQFLVVKIDGFRSDAESILGVTQGGVDGIGCGCQAGAAGYSHKCNRTGSHGIFVFL
jgi:hypothetical protein